MKKPENPGFILVARNIKISNKIIDDFIEIAEVADFLFDHNFIYNKSSSIPHNLNPVRQ